MTYQIIVYDEHEIRLKLYAIVRTISKIDIDEEIKAIEERRGCLPMLRVRFLDGTLGDVDAELLMSSLVERKIELDGAVTRW